MRHDFRQKTWGHNIEFWKREDDGSWKCWAWVTPKIQKGDTVVIRGRMFNRPADLEYTVLESIWNSSVDDMYSVTLAYPPVVDYEG